MKKEGGRYEYLDSLRGITLISMILYHAMWDLAYIEGWNIAWFRSDVAYVWQQSICWTFILLSGFCMALGKRTTKRGIVVFAAGAVVTLVTLLVMPEQRVVFGVLTLLGSCMLLMAPLEKLLRRIPEVSGMFISLGLFLITRNVNQGCLGIGGWKLLELPADWYDGGYLMTFLGFTNRRFYSTDYFSLFPWLFLFLTGYFLCRTASRRGWLDCGVLVRLDCKSLSYIGRHSLFIYLLHQPLIYLGMMCCKFLLYYFCENDIIIS